MPEPKKRITLKLSGEGFAPDVPDGLPISSAKADQFGREIAAALDMYPIELAIVVGGGNIWRGASQEAANMDPEEADMMGMLATMPNGIALKDALIRHGACDPRVMSALPVYSACEDWITNVAKSHLDKGRIIIAVAGLGESGFTTDTAAVQRARNVGSSLLLKGTHGTVDGVYTADPRTAPTATMYGRVSFAEVITNRLEVMDETAFTHARAVGLPIRIFNATKPGNILHALGGDEIGTLIEA